MSKLYIFLLLLMAAAISGAEKGKSKTSVTPGPADGVQIMVSQRKKQYKKSEPINLNMTIKNNSSATISIVLPTMLNEADIVILNKSTNKEVPLTAYGKKRKRSRFLRSVVRIGDGKEYTLDFAVTKLFQIDSVGKYCLSMKTFCYDGEGRRQSIQLSNVEFSVVD